MKTEEQKFKEEARLEVMPMGIFFGEAGGFQDRENAKAAATRLETVLVEFMRKNNAIMDIGYVNGTERLVFVEQTGSNPLDD